MPARESKLDKRLTAYEVRRILRYNEDTGDLFWQVNCGPAKAGKKTGSVNSTGYSRVIISGETYYAHRLIWLIMTGEWPVEEIDHINRNRSDNRWVNLREATHSENAQNRVLPERRGQGGLYHIYIAKDEGAVLVRLDLYFSKVLGAEQPAAWAARSTAHLEGQRQTDDDGLFRVLRCLFDHCPVCQKAKEQMI